MCVTNKGMEMLLSALDGANSISDCFARLSSFGLIYLPEKVGKKVLRLLSPVKGDDLQVLLVVFHT